MDESVVTSNLLADGLFLNTYDLYQECFDEISWLTTA